MIGQLLTGRYLILKQLGAGGFSETHLAIDKYLLNQPACVVKHLKVSSSSTISIEKAKRLFETEARVLDRLGRQHSQIPTLFAYCHEQDQVYQVEEYIQGQDLETWFTQGNCLSSEAAIDLLRKVLLVLKYIHRNDVIHRDVKPSNLIQRDDGDIALIDFGAACDFSDARRSDDAREIQSITIGTPGYMPDEQQIGYPQFNSDLYALGISVIQLLTGVRPQQFHIDPVTGELGWQVYLRQRSINPGLVAILDQMVRRDYRLRYQSASEVLAALESLSLTEDYLLHRRTAISRKQRFVPKEILQNLWKPTLVLLSAIAVGGGYYLSNRNHTQMLLMQIGLADSQIDALLLPLYDSSATQNADAMQIGPNNQVLAKAQTGHGYELWTQLTKLAGKTASGQIEEH